MQVNQKDLQLEQEVLNSIIHLIPEFKGIEFHQSTSLSAIYDFYGLYGTQKLVDLDIKVRDIKSNQFPHFFISTDKYFNALRNPQVKHFIVYQFNSDNMIKVYSLDRELENQEIEFTHKRTGKLMKKKVFLVPNKPFLYEFYC